MSQDVNRTARIEARIAPDALAVVKRAAELEGRSVSDFVVAAAHAAAQKAIEATQIIRLSVEDQKRFAEAIMDPPAPSDALRRAAAAYRNLVVEEP
jgi:uncharacterized protein (DUF1778 family)